MESNLKVHNHRSPPLPEDGWLPFTPQNLPASTLFILIGLIGIFANGIILLAMQKDATIRNPFLCSLALADLLSCLGFVYCGCLLFTHWLDQTSCFLRVVAHLCVLMASSLLTLFMGVDRVLVATLPDKYRHYRRSMLTLSLIISYVGVPMSLTVLQLTNPDTEDTPTSKNITYLHSSTTLMTHSSTITGQNNSFIISSKLIPFCIVPLALNQVTIRVWTNVLVAIDVCVIFTYSMLAVLARKGFRRPRRLSSNVGFIQHARFKWSANNGHDAVEVAGPSSRMPTKSRLSRHASLPPASRNAVFANPNKRNRLYNRRPTEDAIPTSAMMPSCGRERRTGRRVSFDRFSIISKELRNRLTRAVLLVATVYITTWSITTLLIIVLVTVRRHKESITAKHTVEWQYSEAIYYYSVLYIWTLPLISNTANAFIYYGRNRDYRLVFRQILHFHNPTAAAGVVGNKHNRADLLLACDRPRPAMLQDNEQQLLDESRRRLWHNRQNCGRRWTEDRNIGWMAAAVGTIAERENLHYRN